eukprot:6213047-Pleurochrysis_carterae.AAC.2
MQQRSACETNILMKASWHPVVVFVLAILVQGITSGGLYEVDKVLTSISRQTNEHACMSSR